MSDWYSTGLNLQRGTLMLMVLSMAAGCRARAGELGPAECQPVATPLPAGATADAMAGEYRLILVADSASPEARRVAGTLRLEPYQAGMRQRTRPDGTRDSTTVFAGYGTANIDLSAVGAVKVGSTMSDDPMSPGVVVLERRTTTGAEPATNITLRLGSEANRRDRLRFDGGYTALYVRDVAADRFAGDWASGMAGSRVNGHFCAVREDGKDGKDG